MGLKGGRGSQRTYRGLRARALDADGGRHHGGGLTGAERVRQGRVHLFGRHHGGGAGRLGCAIGRRDLSVGAGGGRGFRGARRIHLGDGADGGRDRHDDGRDDRRLGGAGGHRRLATRDGDDRGRIDGRGRHRGRRSADGHGAHRGGTHGGRAVGHLVLIAAEMMDMTGLQMAASLHRDRQGGNRQGAERMHNWRDDFEMERACDDRVDSVLGVSTEMDLQGVDRMSDPQIQAGETLSRSSTTARSIPDRPSRDEAVSVDEMDLANLRANDDALSDRAGLLRLGYG